jgi:ring-1,2-phenylacetyl-CoA epoxidase subunit PaaA
MNVDRLSARNKAWDDGEWVRDAALAHAKKQAARKASSTLAAE